MNSKFYMLFVMLVSSVLFLAACRGDASTQAPDGVDPILQEPPAEYVGKTNPKTGDKSAAEAGKATYQSNCASCHGNTGLGDGPAAISLDPPPEALSGTQASDAYLLWRISEGGMMAPFKSIMPAWKNLLTEDQIWELVTYIRSLSE